MEWEPGNRRLVVKVARPAPSRVPVPSAVEPSLKLTIPVGIPPELVTVAVKVIPWVRLLGFNDEATLTVLEFWLTDCVNTDDALPAYTRSPPKIAVIEWLPAASALVLNVAWPLPLSEPVPSIVAPSIKVTVPVGVMIRPLTLAVNVTDWPNALGLSEDITDVVVGSTLTI
jgi:hypothetical protein